MDNFLQLSIINYPLYIVIHIFKLLYDNRHERKYLDNS